MRKQTPPIECLTSSLSALYPNILVHPKAAKGNGTLYIDFYGPHTNVPESVSYWELCQQFHPVLKTIYAPNFSL